jgi:hypothetical protein
MRGGVALDLRWDRLSAVVPKCPVSSGSVLFTVRVASSKKLQKAAID